MLNFLLTIIVLFSIIALIFTSHNWFKPLVYKIIGLFPLKDAENTVVGNTKNQQVREFLCRKIGCNKTGKHYRDLPQSICSRCGHKNGCAEDFVDEWNKPW